MALHDVVRHPSICFAELIKLMGTESWKVPCIPEDENGSSQLYRCCDVCPTPTLIKDWVCALPGSGHFQTHLHNRHIPLPFLLSVLQTPGILTPLLTGYLLPFHYRLSSTDCTLGNIPKQHRKRIDRVTINRIWDGGYADIIARIAIAPVNVSEYQAFSKRYAIPCAAVVKHAQICMARIGKCACTVPVGSIAK
ncbi:hypothetical protein AVEN_5554-1 [Araneus ventricosus]|uniref:Uncharacterized protein n=1 Tax=Araneus ventricosus TaxID=182803 RepID=A0A4Y2DUP5_ARAVE|nr:hypothetical protein AVEN_5554-1 [Araneus ventricosus]